MSINRRRDNVILRSELASMGSASQLTEALKTMISEGQLVRLSSGVYAKAHMDGAGKTIPIGEPEKITEDIFRKLGIQARVVRVKSEGDRDVYVLDTGGRRVSRKIDLGSSAVSYVGASMDQNNTVGSMPKDLDALPKQRVNEFVQEFAQAHHVDFNRSGLDDWAEAVTRASGDDVKLDYTGKLLVALKKQHLISGRQMSRLMTNHIRERNHVRPVR